MNDLAAPIAFGCWILGAIIYWVVLQIDARVKSQEQRDWQLRCELREVLEVIKDRERHRGHNRWAPSVEREIEEACEEEEPILLELVEQGPDPRWYAEFGEEMK